MHLQQTVVRILHGRTVEVARIVHVRGGAAGDAADADDRRLIGVNAQIVAERGRESATRECETQHTHKKKKKTSERNDTYVGYFICVRIWSSGPAERKCIALFMGFWTRVIARAHSDKKRASDAHTHARTDGNRDTNVCVCVRLAVALTSDVRTVP